MLARSYSDAEKLGAINDGLKTPIFYLTSSPFRPSVRVHKRDASISNTLLETQDPKTAAHLAVSKMEVSMPTIWATGSQTNWRVAAAPGVLVREDFEGSVLART